MTPSATIWDGSMTRLRCSRPVSPMSSHTTSRRLVMREHSQEIGGLPLQNAVRRLASLFPAGTLEFRPPLLTLRVAQAKIGDEAPFDRHRQDRSDALGIEDRDPAETDALRA